MKARTRITRIIPALLLICGIFLSLLLCACGESKKDAVLPPIRISEYPANGSVGGPIGSPKELIEGSDAIACVRIGDWLGDTGDNVSTKFEAEVIDVVKGEMPKKITLLQSGTSEFIFTGHPLFTAGNELLVFLGKAENTSDARYILPNDTYYILGSYLTVFDIVRLKSGESYAIARHSYASNIIPAGVRNLAGDGALCKEVFDELKRSDSVWVELKKESGSFYSLDELVSAVKANP